MDLAIISDTHIPSRATGIPDWVRERVSDADHTIHAGDFDSGEALSAIEDLAGGQVGSDALTAVSGNMDGAALDLPEVATVEFEGVEFVVTHGTGPLQNYHSRVADIVSKHGGPNAIGISGHTHDPMDREVTGIRLLNPGSATGAEPAEQETMMTATVAGGSLDVTLHEPE